MIYSLLVTDLFCRLPVLMVRLLLLLFLFPLPGRAQISDSRFRHISTTQGLSSSTVNCIFQDSRGFMWFGTRDGLNRYDGVNVVVYKNEPDNGASLSDNFIKCLYEDANKNLWIGTPYSLNRFNPACKRFTRYDLHQPITAITGFDNDNIWVATLGGGIQLLDIRKGTVKAYTHDAKNTSGLSSDSIHCFYRDAQNNLYAGTERGLNLYNPKTAAFQFYNIHEQINDCPIVSVSGNNQQQLWLGINGLGLGLLNLTDRKFRLFTHQDKNAGSLSGNLILQVQCDNKGSVWVGTVNQGLNLFDPATGSFIKYLPRPESPGSLSNITASAIYSDIQGNLWIGTHRGGVNLYTGVSDKFKLFAEGLAENSLSYNDVKSFYEDDKSNVWVGTDGGGLNLFNQKTGTFKRYKNQPGNPASLSSNSVQTIAQDGQGNLWVGTWGGGLNLLNPSTGQASRYRANPKDAKAISSDFLQGTLLDSKGNFWVATYFGGLNLLDASTRQFTRVLTDPDGVTSFSGNNVVSIGEDHDGNVWFGTDDGGLNCYNLGSKRFSHYFDEDKKKTDSRVIFTDSKGRVWVGMAGLYLFDKARNNFNIYTQQCNLDVNFIKGIAEDAHQNLWVSTSDGLVKLDLNTGTCKKYNTYDGLQDMEFETNSYLKTRDGQMFFGGIKGFNTFYPDDIKTNSYVPPVYITNFQLLDKSIEPGGRDSLLKQDISFTKSITLNYNQSYITLSFVALNYIANRYNQYEYMLEGLDKEWIKAGLERKASYNNLPPGNYTFRVRAANNDGVWNKEGATVTIIVPPPFWLTLWFKILVALAMALIIYRIYSYSINKIKRKKEELERLVEIRTQEILAANEELHAQSENLLSLNDELVEQKRQEKQARQEAEKANQAKSIFLATMSHEIRTPMNGVIGMASVLAETQLSEEQREYTDTIIASGENLLSVINDILDFSKIESGSMEVEREDFNLRQAVEEVMDLFAPKAAQQKIDLIYHLDGQVPPHIVGDSLRLKQVLINLVSNALKFTERGEIFIQVFLKETSEKEGRIELGFSVKDTGIGIREEKLSKLFKAFSQVDSSTTRRYGGTGLGLVICERLVNLMGGQISVSSKFGEGTAFDFFIITKATENPVSLPQLYDMDALAGKRVLVVDDNKTNLAILKIQLEQWKLKPVECLSAKEALDILASNPGFHLLVTDMEMPEMDGASLAKEVREKYPQLPIIMLSSIGDETKRKYPGVFSSILIKPVKQHLLCKAVQKALDQQTIAPAVEDGKRLLSPDFAKQYPLRILVADDAVFNQTVINFSLKKLGYEADIVQNGIEVLEKIGQNVYDVILMDIQMPEMDGLEATAHIRRREGWQPYIVALTANAMGNDKENYLQSGMDNYISKPMKLEDLVKVLEIVRPLGA